MEGGREGGRAGGRELIGCHVICVTRHAGCSIPPPSSFDCVLVFFFEHPALFMLTCLQRIVTCTDVHISTAADEANWCHGRAVLFVVKIQDYSAPGR